MAQRVQIPSHLVGGDVDEGYGKVADAFRRNLSSGREVGAGFHLASDPRKLALRKALFHEVLGTRPQT
jgi:hypothetical protein